MNNINLMIIGIGPHAQRVYLPTLYKHQDKLGINVAIGIDIKEQEIPIREYLARKNFPLQMIFIDPFGNVEKLPDTLNKQLTHLIKKLNITAIIIATEPLTHKAYAKWALKNELHILMDKPISTHKNVVENIEKAKLIYEDYKELASLYTKLQQKKETIFSINVQRRYQASHQKIISLIKETTEKFDAPVTSIQSMHADGQWRLPNEIITQRYHPYSQGYGKCSHSGYHIFDIISQYYQAGYIKDKFADSIEVIASFVQPRGFIKQFNEKNYLNYFGDDYLSEKKLTDKELYDHYHGYGEMDASAIIKFMHQNENICNASINLLHNSFARRSWLKPGSDLYKGNGRVKHETHTIQQGPFQCIQLHSYQCTDNHDIETKEDNLIGGRNHLEIYVFRNLSMFGKNEKALRKYTLDDLDIKKQYQEKTLMHEKSKELVILEFINFIARKITKKNLTSNITSHAMGVKIMSAIYQSHIQYKNQQSPLISIGVPHHE
jgi:predicted dehydrogenase